MKQKVFFYALLLIAAWLPLTATAQRYDFSAVSPSGDTLYYKLNDNDGLVVVSPYPDYYGNYWYRYTAPTDDLIIPDTVSYGGVNLPVTAIGAHAFHNCYNLTSVTIPNSVTSIGNDAFYNCTSLTSVTIPNSAASIGERAFSGCSSLSSVAIPNSVTIIEIATFSSCASLSSVTIPNSVTYIRTSAFSGCNGLTSVTIPNSVTSIGNYAFRNCTNLTSVTIPNSVTYIGSDAFEGCTGLDSVIVLSAHASMANNAFDGTSISYLYWNINNSSGGLADIPKGNLQTVVFGNDITTIPGNSFNALLNNNTQLRHVTLGSGITEIGDNAFRFCNNIDTIVALPSVAPTLGTNALQGVPNTAVVVTSCGADYTTAWGANTFTYTSANAYTLTLGVNNAAYGTATFVQSVDCQQTAIIQATPAANCVFNGWSDGNTDNPRTITLTGNTTLTANFKNHAVVTAQSSSNMMGEVQGSGTYAIGSSATLTANALCNYRFVRWHDNVTAVLCEVTEGDEYVVEPLRDTADPDDGAESPLDKIKPNPDSALPISGSSLSPKAIRLRGKLLKSLTIVLFLAALVLVALTLRPLFSKSQGDDSQKDEVADTVGVMKNSSNSGPVVDPHKEQQPSNAARDKKGGEKAAKEKEIIDTTQVPAEPTAPSVVSARSALER